MVDAGHRPRRGGRRTGSLPLARRLADYIESHKHPYPLSLAKFKEMCGSSDTHAASWRQTVKKACLEIQTANITKIAFLSDDDQICCTKDEAAD